MLRDQSGSQFKTRPEAVRSHEPQPEFEFFLSTGSQKPVDADARRVIRSRVMRNYLQEKRGQKQNVSLVTSDSTVKAGTSLKGRFRLKSREQQEEEERNPRARRKRRDPTASSPVTPSTYANAVPAISNEIAHNRSPNDTPDSSSGVTDGSMASDEAPISAVATIPRYKDASLDPFDVLPVPGGPRLDRLIHYYNNNFYVNSDAVNPTRTWYKFVLSESALFHAMLSTVAMVAWKYSGTDTKPDMLYHHGQTLRKINNWLQALDAAPLDLVVATVCIMTSFESLQGNYETAATHIAALKRILYRHGALATIRNNDSLQRAVAWTSYHYAAIVRDMPFYHLEISITGEYPEALLLEAARSAPTSILSIPTHGFEIYNILHRIHRLGLAVSPPWFGKVDRVAVSNTLHDAEYDMIMLSMKLAAEEDGPYSEPNIASALLVASQLFLYAALRMIPVSSRSCEVFVGRLIVALNREDLFEAWAEQCSLEALLWVVCMGLLVASDKSRSWLQQQMEETVQLLQIRDYDDMEDILKNYAWSNLCSTRIGGVWNEVSAPPLVIEISELEDL